MDDHRVCPYCGRRTGGRYLMEVVREPLSLATVAWAAATVAVLLVLCLTVASLTE